MYQPVVQYQELAQAILDHATPVVSDWMVQTSQPPLRRQFNAAMTHVAQAFVGDQSGTMAAGWATSRPDCVFRPRRNVLAGEFTVCVEPTQALIAGWGLVGPSQVFRPRRLTPDTSVFVAQFAQADSVVTGWWPIFPDMPSRARVAAVVLDTNSAIGPFQPPAVAVTTGWWPTYPDRIFRKRHVEMGGQSSMVVTPAQVQVFGWGAIYPDFIFRAKRPAHVGWFSRPDQDAPAEVAAESPIPCPYRPRRIDEDCIRMARLDESSDDRFHRLDECR